ncbi:MAG: methyltransferase family protein [Promethearchaeota archaeon]
MLIIIIIVLILIFLFNFIAYWIICLKQKHQMSKSYELYKKIFPIIWMVSIFLIPVLNSSFFEPFFYINVSYFRQYWPWFFLIGIITIIFGIKINSLAIKSLKIVINGNESPKLIVKGVYEIVRHPQYFSWFLMYFGITFIFDSLIALIISPILFILTDRLCLLEEKYLLIPKFDMKYDQYKNKTPYRLISPPYNYIFIIMGLIVVYIGISNYFNLQ